MIQEYLEWYPIFVGLSHHSQVNASFKTLIKQFYMLVWLPIDVVREKFMAFVKSENTSY